MNTLPYTMVSENIAIGSKKTPYEPFDIIVNLNYPENGVMKNKIMIDEENPYKIIIKCGFDDINGGMTYENIKDVLYIVHRYERGWFCKKIKRNTPNILFHCYAGVSRSSTMAIAYLAVKKKLHTSEIYIQVKEKRPCIDPNPSFRWLLGLHLWTFKTPVRALKK